MRNTTWLRSYLVRRRAPRLLVIFSMILSGSVFCTLYILTLSCCAGVLDPDDLSPNPSGRLAKVILILDGDEDETKYQQDLQQTRDSNNIGYVHFRRKPLLEDEDLGDTVDPEVIVPPHHVTRRHSHGRRRHKPNTGDINNSVHTYPDGVSRYEDTDEDVEDEGEESRQYENLDVQDYNQDSKASYHHFNNRLKDYKKRTPSGNSHNRDNDNNNNRNTVSSNARTISSSSLAYERSSRKLPQAIIIGVKKGGTRALLEFLRRHPDVRAPGPEPHFFDRNYEKGLEWYRRQMPSTFEDQITMEKTPGYFVTKGVPGRIFNMSKNVKFIVVVRDPVTRAISDYTQALAKRSDIKSFEAMAFEDNSTGLVDTSWGAIRIGVYAKHLERWLQYFPLSQMHFVSGEKLITDPAGEMAKVQDFLGLERLVTEKNFLFNTTKGFPCLVRPDRKKPHCLSKSKGREHPKIDPKVLQRLRDFFRPFNQKFYQMVGQDFGWS